MHFLTSPFVEKIARAALYASIVVFLLVVFLHRDFVNAAVEKWVAPIADQYEGKQISSDSFAYLLASAEAQTSNPPKDVVSGFSSDLSELNRLCPNESREFLAKGILGIHHKTRRERKPLAPSQLTELLGNNIPREKTILCIERLEAEAFFRRI